MAIFIFLCETPIVIGILGAKGFIGQHLVKEFPDALQITRDSKLCGAHVETLFIAAPTSRKYLVDKFPENDKVEIDKIIDTVFSRLKIDNVVLISTIDVYLNSSDSLEGSPCREDLSYGGNRNYFESQLKLRIKNLKICRSGGLFGPGLQKNLIYDFLKMRNDYLVNYNFGSTFQWLPIDFFVGELLDFSKGEIMLKNIVGEPTSVEDIMNLTEPKNMLNMIGEKKSYNVKSRHYSGGYSLSSSVILGKIEEFLKGNM